MQERQQQEQNDAREMGAKATRAARWLDSLLFSLCFLTADDGRGLRDVMMSL